MKNRLLVFALLLMVSCQRQASTNLRFPTDKELFNPAKDEIARKKPHPPKGGGKPTDTIVNPPQTSDACIYLDFDGEQVNSLWGVFYAEPSGLNETQQQQIVSIVRQRYSGFPVEVTNSLSVFLSYPINKRMRVVETNNNSFYQGSGGVAYVGSYLWADDTPSFVFPNRYGNNIEWVAFASTHEAGHMVGLRHQSNYDESCNKTSEYRQGWNMGTYNGQSFIWGIGASSVCCTCLQDDVTILNSNL